MLEVIKIQGVTGRSSHIPFVEHEEVFLRILALSSTLGILSVKRWLVLVRLVSSVLVKYTGLHSSLELLFFYF